MWKAQLQDLLAQVAGASPLISCATGQARRLEDDGMIKQIVILLAVPLVTALFTAYVTQAVMSYRIDEQSKKFEEYRLAMEKRADRLDTLLFQMQRTDADAHEDLSILHAENRMILRKLGLQQ